MPELIQVEGLAEVKAALARFDQKVQDKANRAGLQAAGRVMQAAVTERAPVLDERTAKSTALPPGALKSDIEMSVRKRDNLRFALIQPGKLTYHVVRWVEYGHRLVKGGYSSRKRGKMQGHGRQVGDVPAHPFIRPAFEAAAAPAVQAYVGAIQGELKGKV